MSSDSQPEMQDIAANLLFRKYLDQRHLLSADEWSKLVERLVRSPELASRFKGELIVDEVLSQQLGVSRQDFVQKTRRQILSNDEQPSSPAVHGSEAQRLAQEMRQMAGDELTRKRKQETIRQRWAWVRFLLLLTLLATVGFGAYWWLQQTRSIAIVTRVVGQPSLTRDGMPQHIESEMPIRKGDRLSTLPNEVVQFRYHDGTTLELFEDTSIELDVAEDGGKRVDLRWGGIAAAVVHQSAGQMQLTTRHARATVVGTRLSIETTEDRSRLEVVEGAVDFHGFAAGETINAVASQYAVATAESIERFNTAWPVKREGLAFVFETANKLRPSRHSPQIQQASYELEAIGVARFDHDYAMVLDGGHFVSPLGAVAVLDACSRTGAITVEATLTIDDLKQSTTTDTGESAPAQIIAMANNESNFNFKLMQHRDQLLFGLSNNLGEASEVGERVIFPLHQLKTTGTFHLVISYRPGRLAAYLNGERILLEDEIDISLSDWRPYPLVFGALNAGGQPWHGKLEGVAIYNRFMQGYEATRNAELYQRKRSARHRIPQSDVLATLLEVSAPPENSQSGDDGSALVVHKFKIDEVIEGDPLGDQVLVTRWYRINGNTTEATDPIVGRQHRLRLERLGVNTQLEPYPRSDDFGTPPWHQAPRYYDTTTP